MGGVGLDDCACCVVISPPNDSPNLLLMLGARIIVLVFGATPPIRGSSANGEVEEEEDYGVAWDRSIAFKASTTRDIRNVRFGIDLLFAGICV